MVENAHHSEVGPHRSTAGAGGAAWGPVSRRSTHELVIDAIVPEPLGGAHRSPQTAIEALGDALEAALSRFDGVAPATVRTARRAKFLAIGRA